MRSGRGEDGRTWAYRLVEEVEDSGAQVAEDGGGRAEEIEVAGDLERGARRLVEVVAADAREEVRGWLAGMVEDESVEAEARVVHL